MRPLVHGEAGVVRAATYRTLAPDARWRQAVISAAQHLSRQETYRPFLSMRSAPEDLAERGSDDGAFAACQADRGATLGQLLQPLAPSLVASRRALLASAG